MPSAGNPKPLARSVSEYCRISRWNFKENGCSEPLAEALGNYSIGFLPLHPEPRLRAADTVNFQEVVRHADQ